MRESMIMPWRISWVNAKHYSVLKDGQSYFSCLASGFTITIIILKYQYQYLLFSIPLDNTASLITLTRNY